MESYSDDKDDDSSSSSSSRPRFGRLLSVQREAQPKAEAPRPKIPLENFIYQRDQQEHAARETLKTETDKESGSDADDEKDEKDTTAEAPKKAELKDIEAVEETPERTEVFAPSLIDMPEVAPPDAQQEVAEQPTEVFGDEEPLDYDEEPPRPRPVIVQNAQPIALRSEHIQMPEDDDTIMPLQGGTPPPPPVQPILRGPGPAPELHGPDINEAQGAYTPPYVVERVVSDVNAEHSALRDGLRLGLVGGFVAGWWLKRRFARKEMAEYQQETKKQFGQQQEQITYLTAEQQAAQEQLGRQSEYMERMRLQTQQQRPEMVPPLSSPEKPIVERLWPTQEQPIEVEAKQHVEHSSWHNIVVDEHGREVQGAITYGEAFNRELQREQAPQAQGQPTKSSAGLPVYQVGGGVGGPTQGTAAPGSPQELPLGHPRRFDSQNSTAYEPRGPIAAALMNPWLWLMGIVLVIAFFIAAFI